MITLLDYGAGNVRSVINAIESLGEQVKIAADISDLRSAEKLVFPGVGSFGSMMRILNQKGYVGVLKDYLHSEKPFLGICLGMQLFAEKSEEFGGYEGLGIIEGEIKSFHSIDWFASGTKVPHIGWSGIKVIKEMGLFKR